MSEGWVGVMEGRSEDEFCGVARDFEKLVYAVSLGEIGFEVVEEVSGFFVVVVGFGWWWWWW